MTMGQGLFLENGNPLIHGSDSGFLLDTPTRLKLDLSGTWDYEVEGGGSGKVQIPSAYDFVGKVTFTRTFEVTSEHIDKYEFDLVMYGANYNTEVSLNGDFLTTHIGGYTSFVTEIPSNTLQVGSENVIRVVVSNGLDAKRTLPLRSHVWGWRNYGGMLRDVFIVGKPKLFIDQVLVNSETAADRGSATVTITAKFDGAIEVPGPPPSPGAKVPFLGFFVEVFDKISGFSVGKSVITALVRKGDEWSDISTQIHLKDSKLWSPEYPELYLVKCYLAFALGKDVTTVVDEYDINHGIRSVKIEDGNIKLNGRRYVLKGVIWQEDHPSFGSSLPYEQMERDMVLMKSLGANTIRFGNHPPHPYMLNLCDRYGLFAMVELPVTNIPSTILASEYYIDLATSMMKEMISRDRIHPSVLAWGIGDEFESSSQATRGFVESLVRVAKGLDDRPTYFGTRMLSNDVCTDLVDIAAVNLHTQDIKVFKKELADWKSRHAAQPVVLAKFGAEVQPDNHNGYSDPFSYEAQARFYIQRFEILKELGYDGALIWSFNDWKGDRPALTVNSGDPWLHTMGLVSEQRVKRLAYDAVRAVFNSEKFVALPIGNYSASAPIIFVLSGLVVLIGVAYLYNASRRFRDNLNRSVMNSYNFFADVRDQRIVSFIHSTLLGMIISVATAIVVSSLLYRFKDSWVLDNVLSYILVWDNLKEGAVQLILDPLRFIGYFSGLTFLALLLVSFLVMFISPLFKTKIFPFHAYSVTMWATPPLLVLVPVGMIMYRVTESEVYILPSLVLVVVLLAWVLLRWLKGISIVFDAFPPKVYFFGMLSLVGVAALVYFYLDYTQSTSMYLSFMYNVMQSSQ